MSNRHKQTAVCPQCGFEKEVVVWDCVDTDEKQLVIDNALSGNINVFTCPECGTKTIKSDTFLYNDIDRRFMVYLALNDDAFARVSEIVDEALETDLLAETKKYYTYRIVRSQAALREKVAIFENDLDDKVIELCKVVVARDAVNRGIDLEPVAFILFDSYDQDADEIAFALPSDQGVQYVKYPISLYTDMVKSKRTKRAARSNEYLIDFDWALAFYR